MTVSLALPLALIVEDPLPLDAALNFCPPSAVRVFNLSLPTKSREDVLAIVVEEAGLSAYITFIPLTLHLHTLRSYQLVCALTSHIASIPTLSSPPIVIVFALLPFHIHLPCYFLVRVRVRTTCTFDGVLFILHTRLGAPVRPW